MPPEEQDLPPELQPDYSEDGVDLSLVRWMLSLTPAERLPVLDQHSANLGRIRELNAENVKRATIGRGLTCADLLPHSVDMDIGDGIRVRVLNLETLFALKEGLGREKDLAMLPLLRQTLEEQRRREGPVC